MTAHTRILVVDDEAPIADLVATTLTREGFTVTALTEPEKALATFSDGAFDLVILDVMMPGMDGYELCRALRRKSDVPILFLSAKAEEYDQVVGFTLGADDYIPKPFRPRELVARVRARLRRHTASPRPALIRCGEVTIDPDRHTATLLERPLELTPTEFSLLTLLARQPGRPVASRTLYEELWHEPANASSANVVMVHIRNLRRKLAAVDATKPYIENTWGVGYSLRERP